jgi:serine/threonine protein kinase
LPPVTGFHSALRFPKEPLLNGKGSSKPRPDRFGPFLVRADLGASRFGPLYLGREPSTNARVVIRTFELSRESREFGRQSDLLDSFRKLCETKLDHPGLARPVAFGAEGDISHLVYSDLAGTSMDAVMQKDGARPLAEVLGRAKQLADVIEAAASAGVHHGMLAPCDVILDGERTGITGFGLAQALIRAGIPAEAEAPYGSPQRVAGAPPTLVDDVYSLAAILLELLIGTPTDPEQDTSRALRETQGLPERRRIPRPAPHETRLFTTIAGVEAGKLRASFAAAFADEPGERPSTASAFVASFEDAFSNTRGADEVAPTALTVHVVSEECQAPSSFAPLLGMKGAEDDDEETLELFRPEHVEQQPETHPVRLQPVADVESFAEDTPQRSISFVEAPYRTPVRSASRALVVAVAVACSFGAGFGGGFLVGQRSTRSTESIIVKHVESPVESEPSRVVIDDPKPIVPTTQAVTPLPEEKVLSAVPAVQSGRVVVRSTPAGAAVMIDGQSRGVTPLTVDDLALGTYRIEVSHPGHDTRLQWVTLSERRPERSIDAELRATSVPAPATATRKSTFGSLHVASRPSGAQVFVDDNLIGTTPLLLSNVAPGSRRLRIELSGYRIWTSAVQITPSERFRVSASLEP